MKTKYKKLDSGKVRYLKEQRKKLLKECNLSMRKFKEKMPRVKIKKNGDFEVDETRTGKKPSLWQQVAWLRDFAEATKELREEVLERVDKQKESDDDLILKR